MEQTLAARKQLVKSCQPQAGRVYSTTWTFPFIALFFALQGHVFIIGTELMRNTEEEVKFENGHFYTFSGFNVSRTSTVSLYSQSSADIYSSSTSRLEFTVVKQLGSNCLMN